MTMICNELCNVVAPCSRRCVAVPVLQLSQYLIFHKGRDDTARLQT